MRILSFVCLLAVLISAASTGRAGESIIAPVITLPVDDPSLTLAPADAQVGIDPAGFDLSPLEDDIHKFTTSWSDLGVLGLSDSAGIVVTDVFSTAGGSWEYGSASSGWNTLGSPPIRLVLRDGSDTPRFLRFVPDADAGNGTATLVFRAWDGSGTGPVGNGGSPGPYSAETRTLTAPVYAFNDPPAISGSSVTFPGNPQTDGIHVRPGRAQVSSIINGGGDDPDGDALGVAVAYPSGVTGTWRYSIDGTNFAPLPDLAVGDSSLLLYADDWLEYTPGSGDSTISPTTAALPLYLWDQSGGAHGEVSGLGTLGATVSTTALSVDVNFSAFTNSPPVVDTPDSNLNLIVAKNGGRSLSYLSAYDDEGDLITWSIDPTSVTFGTPSLSDYGDSTGDISYNAGGAEGVDTFDLVATDAFGEEDRVTVMVTVRDNNPPTIAAVNNLSVRVGQDVTLDLVGNDPDMIDQTGLTWSFSYTSHASFTATNPTGTTPQFTVRGLSAGSDVVTVYVTDQTGQWASTAFTLTVLANSAPYFVSDPPGELVVAGQPYVGVISADDADGDDLTLEFGSAVPSWLTVVNVGGKGRWELRASNPPASWPRLDLTVRAKDSALYSNNLSFAITVVAAANVAVTVTPPAASEALRPSYGPIAPGSAAGFATINTTFADLFPTRARGLWWSAGYADLPSPPPRPSSAGVFLATTVTRSFNLNPPRLPAPFAVPLAAGTTSYARWNFFGIPPLVLTAGQPGGTTSHPWDDFRLETAAGRIVTDGSEVLDALGSGSESDPAVRIQPLLWNGTSYSRASTITSGTAYWIPNFNTTKAYRLVRSEGTGSGRFSSLSFIANGAALAASRAAAPAVIPQRSGPPAPPSGAAAPATSAEGGGGGGCGGGLAGLLIAGLALLGLRPRRRN